MNNEKFYIHGKTIVSQTQQGRRNMPLKNQGFVHNVFSKVPATYELANHILTLGLDILWRRRAAKIAAASGGEEWADMCTGTGEMAVYLSRLAPKGTK
ncbi:MAG: class I SAM-dependent methyltransferase, partial [Planctomycetota bacterium]